MEGKEVPCEKMPFYKGDKRGICLQPMSKCPKCVAEYNRRKKGKN